MVLKYNASFNDNLISLFQKHEYEKYVLYFMNKSKIVFPGKYTFVENQSYGECDFTDNTTFEKFDAKLPFEKDQVKLLTSGRNHNPLVTEWLKQMQSEAADFNPLEIRSNPDYNIANTKLYQIIKDAIEKDNIDEHIIFFLPYPIVLSVEDSIFLQFAGDYLKAIYSRLNGDLCLHSRKIYAIYPASKENQFALRELSSYQIEYITCEQLGKYFT